MNETPLSPQDALVAIMIAVSASDEAIRTVELVQIANIVENLPIFAAYQQDHLQQMGTLVMALLEKDDGLDQLFARDGQTLGELEAGLEMSRFGVMKHLKVLEEAGLVISHRQGREKRHFLNPVPIRLLHDRWIDKYTEQQVTALADLKGEL